MASWFYRTFDTLLDKTVLFSYIRTGYALRRRMWDPADLDVDMTGKACIVTGANSGLGLATTERLADLGASVYMIVRNQVVTLLCVGGVYGTIASLTYGFL